MVKAQQSGGRAGTGDGTGPGPGRAPGRLRLERRPPSLAAPERGRRPGLAPLAMVAPFLALFAFFFILPLVYSLAKSTTSNVSGAFTGFTNYGYVFQLGEFWQGVVRMIYFGVIQVTVMIVLALVIALFLDSPYCRGRRFFSVVYFLPFAVPGVIAAIMWGFLFSPTLDVLLRVPHALGLASGPVNPLGNSAVLYAIMLIVTWEATGYNMTIYLTGLSSVTRDVIEAARLDGASEWRIAWRVKVPLLRPTIIFTVILSIIGTLQLFNEPEIINSLTTLPAGYTPNLLIYQTAFDYGNIPIAAAESVVLAVIIIVASVAFFRIVRLRDARDRAAARPRPAAARGRLEQAGAAS
jgi:multiple sugar transport system permease protein